MPSYAWMKIRKVDANKTRGKMIALQKLGVPYTDEEIDSAVQTLRSQAELIAADLRQQAVEIEPESKMIALIAYLQRLGRGPQPTESASTQNVEAGRP